MHALAGFTIFEVDFNTLLGLLSLCSLIQMEHLLDIQSYKGRPEHETDHFLRQFDTNCVPDHERIARAHARGQARELMDWMSTKFALNGISWRELAEKWPVYHMMSVVNFQKYLEEHGKNTKNKLTSNQVARQFYWCCMKVPESTVGNIRDTEMQSVAWPWPREYKVTYSTKPIKANWETGERIFVVEDGKFTYIQGQVAMGLHSSAKVSQRRISLTVCLLENLLWASDVLELK